MSESRQFKSLVEEQVPQILKWHGAFEDGFDVPHKVNVYKMQPRKDKYSRLRQVKARDKIFRDVLVAPRKVKSQKPNMMLKKKGHVTLMHARIRV